MLKILLAAVLVGVLQLNVVSIAQTINLSPSSLKKLNGINSGTKKLLSYYKFVKKDSLRRETQLRKLLRKKVDSTFRTQKYLDGLHLHEKRSWLDSIRKLNLPSRADTLAALSAKHSGFNPSSALNQLPALPREFERVPAKYQESLHNPMISTLGDRNELLHEAIPNLPKRELNSPENPIERFEIETAAYKQKYQDISSVANSATKQIFTKHADLLKAAESRIGKLLSRYQKSYDSQVAGEGIRRASLKGRSFRERLFLGTDFNMVDERGFSFAFSPSVGFKLNSRCVIGMGYRMGATLLDTASSQLDIRLGNHSIRAFVSYDVYKAYFVHLEWQRTRLHNGVVDERRGHWRDTLYGGAGKKILVHPKLFLSVLLLCLLNDMHGKPLQSRFEVRVGFQLSDLATRKKEINYHPNE